MPFGCLATNVKVYLLFSELKRTRKSFYLILYASIWRFRNSSFRQQLRSNHNNTCLDGHARHWSMSQLKALIYSPGPGNGTRIAGTEVGAPADGESGRRAPADRPRVDRDRGGAYRDVEPEHLTAWGVALPWHQQRRRGVSRFRGITLGFLIGTRMIIAGRTRAPDDSLVAARRSCLPE